MNILGVILVIMILIVGGSLAFYYSWKNQPDKIHFILLRDAFKIRKLRQREYGLKTLKKRLEKGEITQEEYDELKKQFE